MKFDRVQSQKAAVFCGRTKFVIQDSAAWIPELDTKGWKALVRSELFTWSAFSTLPRTYVRSVVLMDMMLPRRMRCVSPLARDPDHLYGKSQLSNSSAVTS
jgi:hypothetical protein